MRHHILAGLLGGLLLTLEAPGALAQGPDFGYVSAVDASEGYVVIDGRQYTLTSETDIRGRGGERRRPHHLRPGMKVHFEVAGSGVGREPPLTELEITGYDSSELVH